MFQALFSVLISSQPLGQHAIRGLDTNHYSTFSPLHRVTPMLVSVSTLLWSKSGHCRLGEDDGGDGASRVELQDMSSPSVNAVDQQKLDEFLQLKYQNLMDELQVLLVADEASLEVVEEAARDIMASYPQPPTDISEEEHLRELQGLVLEFGDWKLCDSRDRQHMLISRFRTLLLNLGCNEKTCKEVSLPYLENELENLESCGHSVRFVSNLRCIPKEPRVLSFKPLSL